MTSIQKNFIYNLVVVVISAVLSFLMTYVNAHLQPVEAGMLGGTFATGGVALKTCLKIV